MTVSTTFSSKSLTGKPLPEAITSGGSSSRGIVVIEVVSVMP